MRKMVIFILRIGMKKITMSRRNITMPEKETKTIEEQLIANAIAPKIADIDGQRIEQHDLEEQIAAIKFAASLKASKSRGIGIRIGKMNHGGAE